MNIEELKKEIEIKEKELLNLKEELKTIKNLRTMIIFNVNMSVKKYDIIKKELKKICGEFKNVEEYATKKLAYEIKGNKEGFYFQIDWEGTDKNITDFEKYARETKEILKFLTIRNEEE